MNPLCPHRSRRRRRPRMLTTVTAAAAGVMAISAPLLSVEAAFSTPSFTSRTRHITSQTMDASLSVVQNSASDMDDPPRRRRQLNQSCQPSSTIVSMDQLLEKGDPMKLTQSKFYALQHGGRGYPTNRLSSLSGGRYGGLGSSSRSPTSLSVSRSSNVLGFRVEDFEPYNPNNNNNDDESIDDDLQFMIEDFDNYDEDSLERGKTANGPQVPIVRTMNPRKASPTSQRVAASILKNGSTTQLGSDLAKNAIHSSSRSTRPPTKSKLKSNTKSNLIGETEDVPPWFPWVPTETQINSLKVIELRAACRERGIQTSGKKAELQQRLLIWATVEDRKRVKRRLSSLKDLIRLSKSNEKNKETAMAVEGAVEEVMDKYDVDALTNKRKALTKEKKRGGRSKNNRGILGLVDESYFKNTTAMDMDVDEEEDEDDDEMTEDDISMVTSASITRLSNTFNAPASTFSNREVRDMYIQSKIADQAGDRARSKSILTQLREATPHDMRVVRRLSRMEMEDGNLSKGRKLLQDALGLEPDNAHLLHGLGQLERKAGNDYSARKYFRRAIKSRPTFANPYHALGTLEHTHGNIRVALTVIKEGIKNCPQNHRLYHALGDVYLDANMLDLAEESYLEGLQHGPQWSKSFFYTSLSYVSYALGHMRDCRTLLRQSLEINGGMHAQGVIALAQLEESEGNIQDARKVYRDAVSRYEKKRRGRSPFRRRTLDSDVFDTSSLVDGKGHDYTRSYSGDKWINVFQSWARMEEVHGTYETAHIVYGKAARLFPDNVGLLIRWAELQASDSNRDNNDGIVEKARLLYEAACHRVGGRSAEPYVQFAMFEMKRRNFVEAQSILMRGAKAVGAESSGSSSDGMARLFHIWGVCEYRLGSLSRAEQLFDDALRVTGSEEGDYSVMRSLILYSMARLEFSRKEYLLAQHCIALSLKENLMPGGNSLIWKLWSEIAEKMENAQLATKCKEQALIRWEEERGSGTMVSDLSRLLGERQDTKSSNGRLSERTGSAMKDMFRKTPWYSKVCPPSGRMDKNWYSGAKLWDL